MARNGFAKRPAKRGLAAARSVLGKTTATTRTTPQITKVDTVTPYQANALTKPHRSFAGLLPPRAFGPNVYQDWRRVVRHVHFRTPENNRSRRDRAIKSVLSE
jgi:hypothetical protein